MVALARRVPILFHLLTKNARLSFEPSSRRSRSKRRRGRRSCADTACLVSMNLKMVELRGVELEMRSVNGIEDETLALPPSARGGRRKCL